jgi:alpha,alpha-trehalose phosphorylase
MRHITPEHLPLHRYPIDPWRLVEREYDVNDIGVTETIFAVANGYIGMRANPEEGRDAHSHGTYLNAFHETWHIHHAEEAYGFAKTGQTIVNVPDAKLMKLYIDDEPLLLSVADLEAYERVLDFREGTLTRDLVWRTPAGKRVRVRSQRLVSLAHRHLAMLTFEVTVLDGSAPVVVSSQLLNRQDGEDEYHVAAAALGHGRDPRQMRRFDHRVLIPRLHREIQGGVVLGYRCANSGMTLACAYRHIVESSTPVKVETTVGPDLAKTVFTTRAEQGQTIRLIKLVTYHTSRGVPPEELADRCARTLDRAVDDGPDTLLTEQREWLGDFWQASDVQLRGDDATQQAIRWNLFELAQASAQTQEHGIGAKGLTGGGYEGHYFWDTEIYIVPFLAYTNPDIARKLVRFRWHMLPAARQRAAELNQRGALYPWRTINGEEASAYYAAGTAQYHINAAIAFALKRYVDASGDIAFLATDGAEILVETARMWNSLGFYSTRRDPNGNLNGNGSHVATFHIHGVTGPDEYTAVVNDNLYTNVMARFNLRYAARVLELLEESAPEAYAALARRVDLGENEAAAWVRAAETMYLPYDAELGVHPQDADFLDLQPWDFAATSSDKYPLLLHFHPLVIYRHQVLKQADVVLAMSLRNDQFPPEVRRRNFDYYDPITTGDSSLSACVQATAAAQIGYSDLAVQYFREALFVDLVDLHGNAKDGVHVASTGGVWDTIAFGFAGMYETGRAMSFDPKLPSAYRSVTFRAQHHGSRMRIELDEGGCTVTVIDGEPVPIHTMAGWTGLTPEPVGEEAVTGTLEEASPPQGPDTADVDRVVPVAAGQSLRIPAAAPKFD